MKTEISKQVVKKEYEATLITNEFKCDECGVSHTLTSENAWIRPDGWEWAYTQEIIKLLCESCWKKREELKKSKEFVEKQEMIRQILESLQDYYESEDDEITAVWYYEPEEVDYILNILKESLHE